MVNFVTQAELDQAKKDKANMNSEQMAQLQEIMAEATFERKAAFGGNGALAPAFVKESGIRISPIFYELCYKARVSKLFEERARDTRRP